MPTHRHQPPTVDLSIDFDFFIREDQAWDLGHSEDSVWSHPSLWLARYRWLPLHAATDPHVYADFLPNVECLLSALESRRIQLSSSGRVRSLRIADSHVGAKAFFASQRVPADFLVNIDAHHDAFTAADQPLSCENWVSHFARLVEERKWATQFVQLYPRWKSASLDGRPKAPVRVSSFADFALPTDATIRNVYLCRSSAWVPPHHDLTFYELANDLARLTPKVSRERLPIRPAPSAELAAEWRATHVAATSVERGTASAGAARAS